MSKSNVNNIKVKSYYSYGSTAYDLEPIYRRRELEEENRLKQEKQKRAEAEFKRTRLAHNIKFLIAVLFVFGGCMAMMIPHTMVVEQTALNSDLRDKLSTVKAENVSLEADIANKVNLEYVETEAAARLGMSEPQSYQVTYIDVPKQSYTVQYAVEDEEEADSGFKIAGLSRIFKKD